LQNSEWMASLSLIHLKSIVTVFGSLVAGLCIERAGPKQMA
jgi:hypothetical protein